MVGAEIEKAQRKVDHQKLVQKMKDKFWIEEKVAKWQPIIVQETKSKKSGVIQGSLGPVFLFIFISDISKKITFSKIMAVDDAKIKEAIVNDGVEKLQKNLDILY